MVDRKTNPPAARGPHLELAPGADGPARPTSVLVLDSLGKLPPATAVALILTVGGLAAGAVVALVSLAAAVLAAAMAMVGMVTIGALALVVLVAMLRRPA